MELQVKHKPIVMVDMDGVLCDIATLSKQKLKETPDLKYPQSQYGFFIELPEIPHSVDTVKLIAKYFDVWFLTAPSTRNPMSYAEKNYWIRHHFGQSWCDKLIICPDKSLLRADYLIDDNLKGRGQDKFQGDVIHYGSPKYRTMLEVYDYLKSKLIK